ncbi:MAG: hypothetical protein AB8G95_04600 [Anaerolineae bacterium]
MSVTGKKHFSILLVLFLSFSFLAGFGVLFNHQTTSAAAACTVPTVPTFPSKTGFYVLAYDNNEEASFDLGSQYEATVNRLVVASINVPDSLIVILADLGGEADTHMIVATNGVRTQLDCLPNEAGILDPELREFDTADGDRIGDFLEWGMTTFNPNSNIHFSYIGHGNPVSPHTVPSIHDIIEGNESTSTAISTAETAIERGTETLSPLPSRLGANPSFTDHHAPTKGKLSLITPHAIATALARATNDGANKFDTVDLLHCFAATIDELNEVAPYVSGIIASPNYAFFDPQMPGVGFEQSNINDVILTYDSFHPPTGHPHIIMGIEADTIIDTVNHWGEVSDELLSEFNSQPQLTSQNLINAYRDSVHYDTTVCEDERDWELGPPDALVDMKSFAIELQNYYGLSSPTPNSGLVAALAAAENSLEGSILSTVAQNGTPYFDEDNPQVWTFLTGESGVSLFTPFEPTAINDTPYLPWQTLWYTETLQYELPQKVEIMNPYPFKFITENASASWADVLAKFWEVNEMRPGRDIETFFCPAEIITMSKQAADLEADIIVQTKKKLEAGDTFSVSISLANQDFSTALFPTLVLSPTIVEDPCITCRTTSNSTQWLTLLANDQSDFCRENDQEVRCEWKGIDKDDSLTVNLTYALAEDMPTSELGLKINVFSDNFDPNPSNNQLSQLISIQASEPPVVPPKEVFLPVVNR